MMMENPIEFEAAYQEFVCDLKNYVPDGVIDIDLPLLQDLNLLNCDEPYDGDLTHSFYVIESPEKLTLFNQKYVVWIVPQVIDHIPTTYTLIALNEEEETQLEMVFATAGVYNHSSLVLRILEKFLDQIEENEKEICRLDSE